MTAPDLRDQFAMAALTGLLANSESIHAGAEPALSFLGTNPEGASHFARKAYALADAMLAQRARTTEGEGG